MNMYTVMRNPSTVWIKRASTWNRVWALVLASPGTPYIAAARKEKKTKRLCFFSLRSDVSCLFYMVRLCCVYFLRFARGAASKEKKNITAEMYAFPCDATRVHRGALSLDTNTETSCPHLLPSLTTSCNVIYKPSSSRVGILFFFIHHSLTRVVQRTKGLLVYHFAVECFLFFFSRDERAFPRSAFFSLIHLPPLTYLLRGRWQLDIFFVSLSHVCVCMCVPMLLLSVVSGWYPFGAPWRFRSLPDPADISPYARTCLSFFFFVSKSSSGCESCVCLILRIHITIFILLSNNNKVDLCPCLSALESLSSIN